MTRKKDSTADRLLTEVELELMRIIWDRGEVTVREVLEALPKGRALAYTSVATVMKILEKKRILGSRKAEHVHTYFPLVTKPEYETKSLRHLKNNVFEGDPSSMVMRLLSESSLSQAELENIKRFLEERLES